MCHISELDDKFVDRVDSVCKVGDILKVKVIAIDDQDRVKLSRKVLLREAAGMPPEAPGGRGDRREGPGGGRPPYRGGGEGREGGRPPYRGGPHGDEGPREGREGGRPPYRAGAPAGGDEGPRE